MTIIIPSSVKSIGDLAFAYCRSLSSITMGDGVSVINFNTFVSTAIPTIIIPESITTIAYGAFSSCSYLSSVNTSNNSVTSISGRDFASCRSLASVTMESRVTSIFDGAFEYTALTTITLPDYY
jgi:BspA type Leucine rich repeat region (6 copies)